MRIHEAVHKVLEKFSPMTDKSSMELSESASKEYYQVVKQNNDYDEALETNNRIQEILSGEISDLERIEHLKLVKDLPPQSLINKVVRLGEKWYMRYVIGLLFIYIVKRIQDSQNPELDEESEFLD